ncbi:hypothetical protein BGM26_18540 [Bacillus sp. FJAT-29790]|uniref:hypothetical protein n=1 Tax=Bacillus sp. FJAT-29790 TaxID=1895002 RepID=UPI001C22D01D|nr:hypothetical protein [Bacillus sp. FJAT-29790]MBU8880951.1 hypothetical protein [Bacillus sp. FJAT-29790]
MSIINVENRTIRTFVVNKTRKPASATDGGRLERPIDITFGKQNEMYITDFRVENLISKRASSGK